MSMLAGPRRKQKVINLRAKNNAWSNDSTKFGQRMLEKMGWSSGKGLGAKENGIVEHVVARYKNDEKGLGFDDKNDQWTKHEDDFNALLANLSNGDDKEIALHSGVSLEDKSKKSKARIHYHKFTRGKDLSKYSEKDLANIFGKKSLKNEEKKEEINEDPEISEKEKVFTEKGSMEDYFKNKMAAKSKMFSYNYQDSAEADKDYSFKGFSGTNDVDETEEPHQGFGFGFQPFCNNNDNTEELENTAEEINSSKKNKKKKKSKNKDNDLNESVLNAENNDTVEIDNAALPEQEPERIKVKKSKKKKQLADDIPVPEGCDEEQEIEPPAKKKKKKAKEEIKEEPEHIPEEDSHIAKKKKKKKNKDIES